MKMEVIIKSFFLFAFFIEIIPVLCVMMWYVFGFQNQSYKYTLMNR